METALPLNAFVKSDVSFSAHFESDVITLDDTDAFIRFLKALVDAAQTEIRDRTDQSFEMLPVVSVSGGSIRLRIEVKPNSWTVDVRAKVRDVFLAIALALAPSSTAVSVAIPPPPLSVSCEEAIQAAHHDAQETWKHFGKGFTAEFEASCGTSKIRSSVKVPPSGKH